MKIDEKEMVECLRGFALGLRGAGHIAGAEVVNIAADRIDALEEKLEQTEMTLEVTRMNLGNSREECNRLEYENEDLKRRLELVKGGRLNLAREYEKVKEELRRAVESEPVVHAHWIYWRENGFKRCKCSECLTSYGCMDTPRCPNCGAHMDEEVVE